MSEKPAVLRNRRAMRRKATTMAAGQRISRQELQALNANLADGMVYQINSGPDGRQRRFTYLSPAVEKLHGLKVADVMQDPMLLYSQVVEADRAVVAQREAQAFATRSKFEVEVRVRVPSGEIRWRRFTSFPRGCVDGSLLWDGIEVDITERRQVEELHRESEERFRMLLQCVPTVSVQGYAMDGTTLYWNEASERIFGYTAPEAIGKNLLDLIVPPEMREEVRQAMACMAESGQPIPAAEVSLLRKDGSRVELFSSHAVVARPGHPPELFCIDVDLTERKWAAEALARSNEALSKQLSFNEALLESIPIPVFFKDVEGRYMGCNRAFCEVLGVTLGEIVGKTVHEVWPRDLALVYQEQDRKLLDHPVHQVYEYAVCTKGGETLDVIFSKDVFFDQKGLVRGIVGSFQDITSRKRAEEALKASEARFRSIFDHIGSGIALIGKDMEIQSLNPRMQEWFPHIDPAGHHICYQSFNVPPRDAICEYCPTVLTLEDGKVHSALSNTPSPEGMRHYRIIATPMFGQDGTIEAAIEMVDDITDQYRAQETLKKRERQLTESQKVAKIGSWSWDLVQNTLDWSEETFRRFDKDPATFTPTADYFVGLVHPEDKESIRKAVRESLDNDLPYHIKPRIINETGRQWVLEGYGVVERDATGNPIRFAGTVQDITDRQRTEQALLESERLYRNLVETTAAVAWEVDIASQRFSYISPQIKEISGFPAEQWTGVSFWAERIHPEDRAQAVSYCQAETVKGMDHAFEYRMLAADGSIVWIRDVVSVIAEQDRPVTLRGYFIDMTASKLAEEKIRQSEEFIRGIHNSMDDGLIVVDRNYRIMSANQAYCQQTGKAMAAVIGRSCFQVTHQNTKPCHEAGVGCAVKAVFETGEPSSVMHRHEDPSGNLLYVETKAFPLKDDSGTVTAAIEVIHNVTERYLLEAEQLKTQKLEAIGRLAGGIAHDFNNLLQGVFGYVSMAKMSVGRPEKVMAMLEQAEKALSLSVNLTTQLLTFAKGGKPTKKTVNLKPLIENATKFALSGSPCNYRLDLAQDLWSAEVDEGQLSQVIQNIVLNASEAMPTPSTVEVSANNVVIPEGGNHSLPKGGRFVRIAIKDSGIGIQESYLSRIFDPYFTTKQKGSGLGLATSYSIIKNHGGAIDVVSTQNVGTTFFITLRASECQLPVETKCPVTADGQQRKGRILVMDDEELVLTLAQKMVEALGHEVEGASHGEAAVEKYRQALSEGKPFDLVILDLTIKGGMGGERTIEALLEMDPNVKAIVSSGYSDDPVVSEYRAHGFIGLLNKPYSLMGLKECLDELVR